MYKFCLLQHRQQGCLEVLEGPVWNTSYPLQHCSNPFALWGKAENHPKCILHCPKTHKLHLFVFQRGSECLSSCNPETRQNRKLSEMKTGNDKTQIKKDNTKIMGVFYLLDCTLKCLGLDYHQFKLNELKTR